MLISRVELAAGVDLHTLARVVRDDSYDDHRAVWRLFTDDPQRRRDFLFRREDQRQRPAYLTVSERPPHDPDGIWTISSKQYAPKLSANEHLAFALRANPVVSRRDEHNHQLRHDLVMDAKKRLEEEAVAKDQWPPLAELCQKAGITWLQARAERCGFSVDSGSVLCEGYRRHRMLRKGREIVISTLEISGSLQVQDPERLRRALFTGIGPAKSFGCGLMLVRRI